MSTAYATRGSRPLATARPTSAVPIGSPIAIREPNATSSTTIATRSPIPSLAPAGAVSNAKYRSPPASICSWVDVRRSSRADLRFARSCGSRCWVSGYCTRTRATSPSVVTEVPRVWGSAARVSSTRATSACSAGVSSAPVAAESGVTTTSAPIPISPAFARSSSSAASWESRPGASNGSSRSCPKAVDAARTSMAMTTQAPITVQGRRAAKRPRRARVSDMDPPSRPDAGGHIGREAGAGSAQTAEEGSAFRPVSTGVSFPTLKR